jgi:hypothetical protein
MTGPLPKGQGCVVLALIYGIAVFFAFFVWNLTAFFQEEKPIGYPSVTHRLGDRL